jgi:hypothetical protein
LTCLQKRCLDALLEDRQCIDTKNLSSDDTIRMLRNNSTLLSVPAIVDFMSKLLHKNDEHEQGKTASLQRELKRFQLLPAREVEPAGGNYSNDNDDDINRMITTCGRIMPVYSCASPKYLPEHLQFGQDHDFSCGGGGYGRRYHQHCRTCPGHVLTSDRKRVLFTYKVAETHDLDVMVDTSEEDSVNDDNDNEGDGSDDDEDDDDEEDEQDENASNENDDDDDNDEVFDDDE